ncbi:MAG TPA: hypothetical protein VKZ50_13960 [bacterium]|nr:hypothetical protein [bacterium]
MSLPQWHAWSVLLVVTLAGDALCVVIALFGDLTRRYRMPHIFWWILWLAQIPLGIQLALGLVLLAEGLRPQTPLHYLYGGLVVATVAALFTLRPGSPARGLLVTDEAGYRESRWVGLLCLFLLSLVGRAYMTGTLGH